MLVSFAFYPFVPVFLSGPPGLLFCFLLDPPDQYQLVYPISWMSFPQAYADFGAETAPSVTRLNHRRFVHTDPPNRDEVLDLLRWVIEHDNAMAFHASDPCEFRSPDDPDRIDFITAYEHALTVERILQKGLSSLVTDTSIARKETAMEIADLIETLREKIWGGRGGGPSWFQTLFHPVYGRDVIGRCLDSLPEPVRTRFLTAMNQCYDELRDGIRDSVWVTSKITPNGVMVRNRDLTAEIEEPLPDFVASVVRALRNAQHGYLTRADQQGNRQGNRPSRYLALVRGALPDSFSYLGSLFALALLANPAEMIGWNWMQVGIFD